MSLTTDPTHPDLTRYTGPETPGPQAKVYLVLSEEERTKGFIRPYRDAYTHQGPMPTYPLRYLSAAERNDWKDFVAYEEYPEGGHAVGRYWTQEEIDNKGCGVSTKMGSALSETYARDPKFYGATYCVGCKAHFPVNEFTWDLDGKVVGS